MPSAGWARRPGRCLGSRRRCSSHFLPRPRSPAPDPGPQPGARTPCPRPGPRTPCASAAPSQAQLPLTSPDCLTTPLAGDSARPHHCSPQGGGLPRLSAASVHLPRTPSRSGGGRHRWQVARVQSGEGSGPGVGSGGGPARRDHPAARGWGRCSQLPWGHGAQGTCGTGVPPPPLLLLQPLPPPPLVPSRCSQRDDSGRSGLPAAAIHRTRSFHF